jgi:hypothetical protein
VEIIEEGERFEGEREEGEVEVSNDTVVADAT